MKETVEIQLLMMITEIYQHLGLDGDKPFFPHSVRDSAKNDILLWNEKRLKKKHERSKN